MSGSGNAVIVDYGMGNLHSVKNAVEAAGGRATIAGDPDAVRKAERIILPGVGAFGDAVKNLRRKGLDAAIREAAGAGTPLLGLCLGLQLLFTRSEEFGDHEGLNLIPGNVRRFRDADLRVPHVGWNQIEGEKADPLLEGIPEGSFFYFVHSYYVEPSLPEHVLRWTSYGGRFCSIAGRENVRGTQFHPEKSQDAGQALFRNFLRIS